MLRVLDLLLALLFATAAVVQYNDPDPLLWMLFYGCVALVAGTAAFGRYSLPFTLLVTAAAAAGLLLAAPGFIDYLTTPGAGPLTQQMDAARPYVEQAREFLGLAVALGVLVFYALRARRAQHAAASR
ncbi:MAG: transmembrane 220 family protein [Rhodothermales bacterium]|nr:transmembrane 220 family protein [Rhodothermales bacterium]